jgi:outer membrane protein assembly factor BamD (BamD/ComL family)
MCVSGLAASSIFQLLLHPSSTQSNFQKFQKEFHQLGQDLSSGNLSQAQSDFASLEAPVQATSAASTQTTPLASAMAQLSQDLQSGNLSAAQQDYATVQKDLQQTSISGHHHHHHHAASAQDSFQNPINQLFAQLGQALQAGNLSSAQTAYATLQQDFQSFGAPVATATSTPSSTLDLSA